MEQSSVPRGLSPPLQISHSVVPNAHLSVAELRFRGSFTHSGGTQGIRSTNTGGVEGEVPEREKVEEAVREEGRKEEEGGGRKEEGRKGG